MEPKTLAATEEKKLVEQLCRELTCACARPHPPTTNGAQPPTDGARGVVTDNPPAPVVANLSPTAFLATLRQAAVDASSVVGEFARARLLSFSGAFARGWGPAGPGRYERRSVKELVDDKIYPDLNLPAEDDPEPEEARERRRKRNVPSSPPDIIDLDPEGPMDVRDGANAGPSKRMRNQCLSPPCIIDLDPEDEEQEPLQGHQGEQAQGGSAGARQATMPGEEQDQDGNARIRKTLEGLISKVQIQAPRPVPEYYWNKVNWFRSQVAKQGRSAVETSANVSSTFSNQPASRYSNEGTVGATELQSQINVTSAQPEVRSPEIGSTSAIAATMPQDEQHQQGVRPQLSQADITKRVDELVSKVKNQAWRPMPLPKHYLGKLYWFRSQVAKDHGSAAETSANISSALSDQPASRYSDEGTVGATELPSQMNVASDQPDEKRPECGTSTIAGGLSPMHGDGGMSSQHTVGNEDNKSEEVQGVPGSNASLLPDVIPSIPQTSPARECQLAIASPMREPDDLDGLPNDLDEMQPRPSRSASAPP